MSPTEYHNLRKQLGLTQAGLAGIMGVTRETINRREKGELTITTEAEFAIKALPHFPHVMAYIQKRKAPKT